MSAQHYEVNLDVDTNQDHIPEHDKDAAMTTDTEEEDRHDDNLKAKSKQVLRSSLSLFQKREPGRVEIEDVDTITPYMVGFVIGWCTWLFGSVLGLFAGRGGRARALRKGLFVGAVAVTLPFAAIIVFFCFLINRWNAFLDKFDFF